MIFVEPIRVYATRASWSSTSLQHQSGTEPGAEPNPVSCGTILQGPLQFDDGWDEAIISFLMSRPGEAFRIVSLSSELRKRVRHRDKDHKEDIKRHIMERVGFLIRAKRIVRVSRKFVMIPRTRFPHANSATNCCA